MFMIVALHVIATLVSIANSVVLAVMIKQHKTNNNSNIGGIKIS
jgi:hypothetical protein